MSTPPIIIKRPVKHSGHHGGAWKVAYADFVTAMMALFIVLWIMNSSKQVQEAVGGYFKDPIGANKVGSAGGGAGAEKKEDMQKLKSELEQTVFKQADLAKIRDQIEMTVTPEGLRIELLESEKGTFFNTGKSEPTPQGRELLMALARELGKIPNAISIEGHTDSRPYPGGPGNYSNWELSTDRANAARRLMQQNGMRKDQVSQVRGFADQRPRKPDDTQDASNRRISVIVRLR